MTDLDQVTERAALYGDVADDADAEPSTTFTDDAVYAAATRAVDALTGKLIAARVIRGDLVVPTVPPAPA